MLESARQIVQKYGGVTEQAQKEYASWVNNDEHLSGGEKAYRFLDEIGQVYRGVSLRAPEPRTDPKFFEPLIHPVTKKPCAVPPNGFSRTPETLKAMIKRNEILFGADETTQPNQKMPLTTESKRQISSVLQDARKGKADVSPMGLDFPYCHPVSLYELLIGAVAADLDSLILDYFAGSGTTGHAVINLNRADKEEGQRRFVLCEMGRYFDSVLVPRLKKAAFADKWKDGRPADFSNRNGVGSCLWSYRLESYEDALEHLAADVSANEQQPLPTDDEFTVRYALSMDTKDGVLPLSDAFFAAPFHLQMRVGGEGSDKPEAVTLDPIATFNWLLGLRVHKMWFLNEKLAAVCGLTPQNKAVVVVWRQLAGVDYEKANAALLEFWKNDAILANWRAEHEVETVYLNGDSSLGTLKSAIEGWAIVPLEGEFRRLMFATAPAAPEVL